MEMEVHCANQHQDKPHNTGNKIIGTLHLRIIKQLDLGAQWRIRVLRAEAYPVWPDGNDICGVSRPHGEGVGH